MTLIRYISLVVIMVTGMLSSGAQTVPVTDAGFKKFLTDSLPATLDASQNLILSNATLVTAIDCQNYGIVTVNELPYFTGLKKLNINKNPIAVLPDLSGLTGLVELNIGETQIQNLPDFSGFPGLKKLSAYRLYLTVFPDVSQNSNLETLIVHTNNFSFMPVLNLPRLKVLDVSLTTLTVLPDLSNLKSLRELDCFRNSLLQLPDLSMLDTLQIVDASTNQLQSVPALPLSLTLLYVDNNELTSLPDLQPYAALTKVRLYSNYLTFEDLLPLTTYPNFSTAYSIAPQKKIPVAINQTIVERAEVTLDSKVDITVSGVLRQWYVNAALSAAQTSRFYNITQAQLTDQGAYSCTFTHPSLPGLTLQTNDFMVTVLPCVNTAGISYDITGSTCLKQGALVVRASAQPLSSYTYTLEGMQSHKVFTSVLGQFASLGDLQYTLTVSAVSGCAYTLPPVTIPREECKQLVITPNDDGVDDTYYFSQTGNAKIVDKFGNTICQLTLPKVFDGTYNGRRMPVGYYFVSINDGEEVLKMSVIY